MEAQTLHNVKCTVLKRLSGHVIIILTGDGETDVTRGRALGATLEGVCQSPMAPFFGASQASQSIRCQAPGGPAFKLPDLSYVSVHVAGSNEVAYPQLMYFKFHAVASLNMS
jgi:hypothetical protein